MKKARKGFTLVELLIVIAIIGVLAAMMTLSSTNATTAAKVSQIVSGFKMVRTAATLYVMISGDETATASHFTKISNDYVAPDSVKQLGRYKVEGTSTTTGSGDDEKIIENAGLPWTITYTFASATDPLLLGFMQFSKDMALTGTASTAVMTIK